MCMHGALCYIPFNLICYMAMFGKSRILTFDPTPRAVGGTLWAKYLLSSGCIRDSL